MSDIFNRPPLASHELPYAGKAIMKPASATAIFALVLSVFVATGMAIGTTSYATGPVAGGYGIAATD